MNYSSDNRSLINNLLINDRGHLLTEQSNKNSRELDLLSTTDLVTLFNDEDIKPHLAVKSALPQIASAVELVSEKLNDGGRLFYIGAGTSGRLGVLDASECPPTFCTPPGLVKGLIAGGNKALTTSSETLEDSITEGKNDLDEQKFTNKDCLIGITSGGTTPYVLGALDYAKSLSSLTICISCVPKHEAHINCDIDIRIITGPELLTGSTRLKAGTATKMALNIISTCVMIKLGKVYGNRMIDVSASNSKLVDRSLRIITDLLDVNRDKAKETLLECSGSVKLSLLVLASGFDIEEAKALLRESNNNLRVALTSLNIEIS